MARPSRAIFGALLGALLLAACGQKGALFMPAHAGAASAPKASAAASGPLVEPPPAVLR